MEKNKKEWYCRIVFGPVPLHEPALIVEVSAAPHTFKLCITLKSLHLHHKVMLF